MALREFLAQHPLFGRASKPLPLRYQERSVYYWWWQYLRRNHDYLACCERGGQGNLSSLYADFGDVREEDFRKWWTTRDHGADLFAEQPREIRQKQLMSKDEWDDTWSASEAAVFVFPLGVGRRKIQSLFAKQLAKIHLGKRGRVSMRTVDSTARYPLSRNFNVNSLKTGLQVYDSWAANELLPKPDRKSFWELGEVLKLIPSALTKTGDTKFELTNKKNVMTVAFSRHLKASRLIIANTSLGRFPDTSSNKSPRQP